MCVCVCVVGRGRRVGSGDMVRQDSHRDRVGRVSGKKSERESGEWVKQTLQMPIVL